MSRHRNIRNIKVEDIFEEEYGFEESGEYGDENFEMTLKHKAQMEEGKIKVKSVIGQLEGITDKDIEDTLWYYYFDTEKTINWLLDKIHKTQARKQKQSHKQAVSNNSQENKGDLSVLVFLFLFHLNCMNRWIVARHALIKNFLLDIPLQNLIDSDNNSSFLEDGCYRPVTSRLKISILGCSRSVIYSPSKNSRKISCITLQDIWLGHNVNWRRLLGNTMSSIDTPILVIKQNYLAHGGLLGGADSETPNSTQPRLSSTRSTYPSLNSLQKKDLESLTKSHFGSQSQGFSLSTLAQKSLSQSTSRISLTRLLPNKSSTTDSSHSINLNSGISQKLTSLSDLNSSKIKLSTTFLKHTDSAHSPKSLPSYLDSNISMSSNVNHTENSLKSSFISDI
ncbi:5788_t:CDS:2 [Scutellospora calospora]|uniref:5788_t:CDS:1 n=1 Tax=Scutellospora calospora TaxID=85575 RepID=A0ACA9MR39_9GLOM|nr:5788_t:CDS:2 [Scutellospora calospora]